MRDFAVHEAILREHSPFFRTALDQKWREGRSKHIDLPRDDGDVVGAYLDWLYFKKIACKPISPPELPLDDGEYHFLARLYAFGEKIQADAFCDDIIDAMAFKTDDVADDGTRTFPSHTAIMALYDGTPTSSPARRFVVEMYVTFGAEHWVPDESEYNHPDFVMDLVHAFLKRNHTGSIHRQQNYLRRHQWHKHARSQELLRPASSTETTLAEETE
ncbi:hypothetical protein DOTSEDRAFT_74030 [Lecanosticta acicola]|uniref:BTB domain-containing protein n=1 Tax=Lecanosticta acicola TaxID=111012 RepID=A0AAI8Z0R5_9PEZI|nr:hypothetical protein DOTSEDRAFT_74030 [Lecanosticta acicola]